jgi:hypothetical protein
MLVIKMSKLPSRSQGVGNRNEKRGTNDIAKLLKIKPKQ